jgi:rare lipoprotein A
MNRATPLLVAIALASQLAASISAQRPAESTVSAPAESEGTARRRVQTGLASYYARMLEGRITASGTRFDNDAMVAAHPTYPFGTRLRVTNLRNQRSVQVRVVDRGPAAGPRARGVIIDLSRAAATALDFLRAGRTRVRIEVLETPDPR